MHIYRPKFAHSLREFMAALLATLGRVALLGIITGAFTCASARAEPSVLDAHAFLKDTFDGGGHLGYGRPVNSYSGAKCSSTFLGASENQYVTIDWTHVYEVKIMQNKGVDVRGKVMIDGNSFPFVYFMILSPGLSARISNAFAFLQTRCDSTRKHGF
jgi:hypothetical protein